MNRSPVLSAAGILLILAGGVWILQGLDVAFAPQSFMTNNRWWVLWGALALMSGILILAQTIRKSE